ncbi:MAG: LLM class flavin-dependent oxidoreductase [Rhodospirillaceae bacterium]|nr:LLM class flavin-dependent oxidoreductase [Rhodospirillaceae bacterium]|tara:strand:- start:740 stop:1681 length:942 start_codon:yes stop_codon:yes gene_type:complete
MSISIGYLLPTRESVMEGRPEAAPLLKLAESAENLGYDSIWVGDSLLARPRHEPITLLAGAAGRTNRVQLGTAILIPALRNPVVMAHQIATLDQVSDGRTIIGVGIAADVPNVRQEFASAGVPWEKRVGRMLEGLRLCRKLWEGKPVSWNGRWQVKEGILGPEPVQNGGPPIWIGGNAEANIKRVGEEFDGWLPNHPDSGAVASIWGKMKTVASRSGRPSDAISCTAYLTLSIDDNVLKAESKADEFMSAYYGLRPDILKKMQACYAGTFDGAIEHLQGYVDAGANHLVLRFAGDHDRHLAMMSKVRDYIRTK